MPEEIVSRILRLPGYGIAGWELDEGTNTLTLSIRQIAEEPYYVCGGCGICPGGAGRCGCGSRSIACAVAAAAADRTAAVCGREAHYTARLEAVVAQDCEAAPVQRVAAQRGLPPETVRRMDKRVLRRWAVTRPPHAAALPRGGRDLPGQDGEVPDGAQ